jgi:hypothetical protein
MGYYYMDNPEYYEEPPLWWYELQDEIDFNNYLEKINYMEGLVNGRNNR